MCCKDMSRKTQTILLWVLRIVLTLACIAMLGYIFSNSLKDAQQSSAQSATVVETVQEVASVIAPDSPIATATGEDYDRLHEYVRMAAHFLQFAALGALMIWCYFSYTSEKLFLTVPISLLAILSVFDEFLQTYAAGRASSIFDMLLDTVGGIAGCIFALLTLVIGGAIVKANAKKKEENKKKTDKFGLEIPEGYPNLYQ